MNLFERLQHLKHISPSADFTARSRREILSTLPAPRLPRFTVRQFLVQNLQLGSAMALTGLLLLLGFGGFSAWKFLSPFGLASLDPANLRAEADAVKDIQVALNTVQYIPPEAASAPSLKSLANPKITAVTPAGSSTPTLSAPQNATTTPAQATTTEASVPASSTPDFSTTTVDAALDYLIQQ